MSSEQAPAVANPAASPANLSHSNMTLQDLKKQHQQNLQTLKQNAAKAQQKVAASASHASIIAARDSNMALQEIFQNEQQLEQHVKELQTQSEHFRKRMSQWSQHFLKLNQAMKEIGDVHNWSQSIHKEVDATLTILDEVSAKKRKVLGLGGANSNQE